MKIAVAVAALACLSLVGVAQARPNEYFRPNAVQAPAGSVTFARKLALATMQTQAIDLSREADARRLLGQVQSAVAVVCTVHTPNTPLSSKVLTERACMKTALRAAVAAVNHPQVDLAYATWR